MNTPSNSIGVGAGDDVDSGAALDVSEFALRDPHTVDDVGVGVDVVAIGVGAIGAMGAIGAPNEGKLSSESDA